MFTVHGKILTEDTKVGLGNLVVAIYDVDCQKWKESLSSSQRLGSALTDENGIFSFDFNLASFVPEDKAAKPDLAICVFAPDRNTSDNAPIGLSYEARLLHISQCPLYEAGNTEAFTIEINSQLLKKHGLIFTPEEISEPEALTEVEIFKNSIAAEEKQSKEWGEVLKPILKRRKELKLESRNLINKILTQPNLPENSKSRFVPFNESPSPVMNEVIKEGFEKMALVGENLQGSQVSVETLFSAFDVDDIDNLPDTINMNDLIPESSTSGVELFRKNDTRSTRKKIMMMEAVNTSTGDTNTDSDIEIDGRPDSALSSNDNVSNNSDLLSTNVQEWINAEMTNSANSNNQTSGVRPDSQTINESLSKDFKVGPADTVAYHDFHSLKMAFKNVWTAPLDGKLSKALEELYETTVEVSTKHGLNAPSDFSEVDQIEDLVSAIEQRITDIEVLSNSSSDLQSWLASPFFFNKYWRNLSTEKQNYILTLHWLDTLIIPKLIDINSTLISVKINKPNVLVVFKVGNTPVPNSDNIISLPSFAYTWPKGSWEVNESPTYLKDKAIKILKDAKNNPDKISIGRVRRLLEGIQVRISQGYKFDVFKPDTYNFGILLTYRQKWEPLSYQVGDLVASIPLAPLEKRTFQKKRVINTKRAQKEIEKSVSTRRFESSQTRRADLAIVEKSQHATNFTMNTKGSISFGVGKVLGGESSFGTQFSNNQSGESASTKKNFREAVKKASSEYKDEHILEVSTEESFTSEFSESGEISNPNNELTVTYLFYELQRRFQVSEELYKVTPVVFIAMDVPRPHEINETWLLEHEWILKRVLLDDSLEEALDYLTNTFAGDEIGVEVLRAQWEIQTQLVEDLKTDFSMHSDLRQKMRDGLVSTTKNIKKEDLDSGVFETIKEIFSGKGKDELETRAAGEVVDTLLEWAESDLTDVDERLREALLGLQSATKSYLTAIRQRLNRRVSIDQLRLHIRQNVLYYMQAIWAHEPPDQRFFRIYETQIAAPELGSECRIIKTSVNTEEGISSTGKFTRKQYVRVRCPAPTSGRPKALHEVADLSRLLGFKGNYAIFPLTESNGITDFMMQDYRHEDKGLADPDKKTSQPTVEEYREILDLNTSRDVSGLAIDSPEPIINIKEIEDAMKIAFKEDRFSSEEIVVPSGQLYIEALPGSHTILEDFKLQHRAADVAKVKSEVKGIELENIRKAARIFAGEFGDPDTEKVVVIDGDRSGISIDPSQP